MTLRYSTNEEKRNARLLLYKDDVFVIAQEAIRKYNCPMKTEELFASADNLVNYLLENKICDKDAICYEADCIEETAEGDYSAFLLLSIAFVKLCALRKREPLAEEIAEAMVVRCQKYEEFQDFLTALDNKENQKRIDGWRADLLSYELKSIGDARMDLEQAQKVVGLIVGFAEHYRASTIEVILNPLRDLNDLYGHAFDNLLDRLKEKLGIKATPLVSQTYNYNAPIGQQITNAGRVEAAN